MAVQRRFRWVLEVAPRTLLFPESSVLLEAALAMDALEGEGAKGGRFWLLCGHHH
jgi:hypothetical protein